MQPVYYVQLDYVSLEAKSLKKKKSHQPSPTLFDIRYSAYLHHVFFSLRWHLLIILTWIYSWTRFKGIYCWSAGSVGTNADSKQWWGSHYSIHQVTVQDVLIDETSVPTVSVSVFATRPHVTLSTAVMFDTLWRLRVTLETIWIFTHIHLYLVFSDARIPQDVLECLTEGEKSELACTSIFSPSVTCSFEQDWTSQPLALSVSHSKGKPIMKTKIQVNSLVTYRVNPKNAWNGWRSSIFLG